MRTLSLTAPAPRRLVHYTPLRYPGGKGKLAPYIKALLKENRLLDGEYVEPYAGGAAVALELLFHDYVSHVHINDISRPVFAFWSSVLHHTEELCRLVHDTPLNLTAWDAQKRVFAAAAQEDELSLGFATFYLNRTNRSGILNGGIIGGRDQSGPWKIDARYNRNELIYRIESVARMKDQISLTGIDALDLLQAGAATWPEKTLIYMDPPYYVKGSELYYDSYQHGDHERVAKFVTTRLITQRWVVSYDNVPAIRRLYAGCQRLAYSLGYSARSAREGAEVIFFSDSLRVCPLVGPFVSIKGSAMTKKDNELYSPEEAQQRFEGALRGARFVGPKPMKQSKPAARKKPAPSRAKKINASG